MLRTQISLTEHERALLDAEAARTGRSVSALIRDAVTAVYGHRDDIDHDLEVLREAFGARAEGVDGADWVEGRRSGGRLRSVESP